MVFTQFRLGWLRGVPVVALLAAASITHAQGSPGSTERADPLDAQARVPAVTYSSSLAGYRRLGDDKRIDWKRANETVNRIGGWRAYSREALQPDPAASTPAGRTTPAPGGHEMH